ncbi:serine protease [Staphylococcus sp. 17KM0847]|uniref:S1 family peptidase n=1 Tax=Staphylococcus sp. 17KM0847 TaxID=2583989 RepID=UPI0015DD3BAB|nr:serine protease [Staphylococcus sp. 17KM0847]QLK85721.1 trypsin-like peptidase domain-containing protein [Staphylococcus sp. 17KM0847]
MKNKLLKGSVTALLLSITLVSPTSQTVQASTHYYNGLESWNANSALQKAKKVNNKNVSIKHYNYAHKTKYKAVGRVSNRDGFKGRGKDSMGTGFVVGNHTFVTNAHVVEKRNGQQSAAKYITFDLNRDGKRIPYRFHAQSVKRVPGYDLVVVKTKEHMVNRAKVQPLKLASNTQIKKLKFNDRLYSLGYPWQGNDNTKAYWNRIVFLQQSSNGFELLSKDKFRSGASGSPLVNSRYEVFGVRTYGHNLRGSATSIYAKQEIAGAESLYGNPRQFILKNAQ